MFQNSKILSFCVSCVTEPKALWGPISVFSQGPKKHTGCPGGVAGGQHLLALHCTADLHSEQHGNLEGWPDILCNCKWYSKSCKSKWVSVKAGCHGWHMQCHECLGVRGREEECLIASCSSSQASTGVSLPRGSPSSRFLWTCHPFFLEALALLPEGLVSAQQGEERQTLRSLSTRMGSTGICDMPAAKWSLQ